MILGLSLISITLSFIQIFGGVYILGTTDELDLIIYAQTVPQFLFIVFNYSISNAIIPIAPKRKELKIDTIIWYLFWRYVSCTVLVVAMLCLLVYLNKNSLTDLLDLRGENKSLLISLININLFSLPGMLLSILFGAGLRAKKLNNEFEACNLIGQFIATIGFIVFLYKTEILVASLFMVMRYYISGLSMSRWYVFELPKINKYPQDINLYNKELKTLLSGTLMLKSTFLFDRSIAFSVGAGSLAVLTLVQQIYSAVEYVITRVMVAPYNSQIARIISSGYYGKIRYYSKIRALQILTLSVFSYFIIIFIFPEISNILYLNANLNINYEIIKYVCILLAGQICFSPLASFLNANFYSAGLSKLPVAIGVMSTFLGLILKFYLTELYGVIGLSLAVSLQFLIAILLLIIVTRRVFGGTS